MQQRLFLKTLLILLSLVFLIGLNSCQKDETPDEEGQYPHFVSHKLLLSRSKAELGIVYTFMGASYPPASNLVPHLKSDISIHKIVYKTDYLQQEVKASGLVCLPKEPGEYPVLCFQNGTNTLYAKAPSQNYGDPLFSVIEGVASMGFIVVIPDYLGFGESEQVFHPYLHRETTVSSILDMLRATNEFTEAENTAARPNNNLFILGYSQGGWATLSLQKAIEQNHSSEFNLVASACGAGPYNLSTLNEYVLSQSEYPMPYFLAYILKGHRSVESTTNTYTDIFNASYASKIDGLFDGKHSGDQINAALTTTIGQLIATGYRSGYKTDTKYASIRNAFTNNSVTAWNLSTPTRLFHAAEDVYIPVFISETMLHDFRIIGVPESKVQLVTFPGYDHPGGVIPMGVNAVLWFLELK